jgi:hypothetical protein
MHRFDRRLNSFRDAVHMLQSHPFLPAKQNAEYFIFPAPEMRSAETYSTRNTRPCIPHRGKPEVSPLFDFSHFER